MHEDPIIEAVSDGEATPSPGRQKPARKKKSSSSAPVVRVEIYTDAATRHPGSGGPQVEAHAFATHEEESLEAAELAELASRLAVAQVELDERERRLTAAQAELDDRDRRLAVTHTEHGEHERRLAAESQRVCEELERPSSKEGSPLCSI